MGADAFGVRTPWRAFGALLSLAVVLTALPVGADGSYPTFENGVLVPTGGYPYDRDRPAVNASSTPLRDGTFVFPVSGSVNYSNTFGACRGTSCSRPHLGVDMLGTKGLPVVAVDAGTIVWVSSTCCSLAIRHPDGWTSYYIHLNNDTPGTDDGAGEGIVAGLGYGSSVSAGQHIGWLGDSGNAEWTTPHLHLEFQDPGGVWHDPTPYADSASPAPGGLPGPPGQPASTTTTTTTTTAPSTTTTATPAPTTTTTTTPTTSTTAAPTTVATPATSTAPPSTASTTTTPAPTTVSTIVLDVSDGEFEILTEEDLEADVPGRVDVPVLGYVAPAPTAPSSTTTSTAPPTTLPPESIPDEAEAHDHAHAHAALGNVGTEPWRTVVYDLVAELGAWLARLGA